LTGRRRAKFEAVTRGFLPAQQRDAIAEVVLRLNEHPIADLTALLGSIGSPATAA
jgi:hypothetical protein